MVGSPCCPRDSQESSPAPQFESISSLALSFIYGPTLTSVHNYWKNHSFDYMDLVSKVTSLVYNTLSRFIIALLPRSKRLLISWLKSPSAVIMEPKKIKSDTFPIVSPSICHEVMGPPKLWASTNLLLELQASRRLALYLAHRCFLEGDLQR